MIVSTMSRRLLRAAGGLRRPPESRALPTFPSTIYLMMCGGLTSQPTFESDLLDATPYERSEDIGLTLRNPRNNAIRLASPEMDSFDIILLSKQISAVKRAFYVRTCPVRKRKARLVSQDENKYLVGATRMRTDT